MQIVKTEITVGSTSVIDSAVAVNLLKSESLIELTIQYTAGIGSQESGTRGIFCILPEEMTSRPGTLWSVEFRNSGILEQTKIVEIINTTATIADITSTENLMLTRRLLALTEGSTRPGTVGTTENKSVVVISESGEKLQDIKVVDETRTPTMHIAIDRTGDVPTHMVSSAIGEEGSTTTVSSSISDAVVMDEADLPPQPEPPSHGMVIKSRLINNQWIALFFDWEGGPLAGRGVNMPEGSDLDLEVYATTDRIPVSILFDNEDSLYSSAPEPLMPRFDLDLPQGSYVVAIGISNDVALDYISIEFSSRLEFLANEWQDLSDIYETTYNAEIIYRPELDPINQEGEG